MRNVFATIAGAVDGVIIVIIFDFIAHAIYPVSYNPDNINITNMGEEIYSIPDVKFYLISLGHFIGFVAGMGLASIISKNSKTPALITSWIILIVILFNLFKNPHPLILDYLEIAAIVGGFFVGWFITGKIIKKKEVH